MQMVNAYVYECIKGTGSADLCIGRVLGRGTSGTSGKMWSRAAVVGLLGMCLWLCMYVCMYEGGKWVCVCGGGA